MKKMAFFKIISIFRVIGCTHFIAQFAAIFDSCQFRQCHKKSKRQSLIPWKFLVREKIHNSFHKSNNFVLIEYD